MKRGTQFWTQHVAAAKVQAISASDYAKRHGISVTALYYWQRKLKALTPGICDESSRAGKFVALRVAQAVVEQRSSSRTLVLTPGMRLEMSALPAPQWLVALVRAEQGAR